MSPDRSFEEILETSGELIYPNVGDSMRPLIRQGKDLMIIEKKPSGRLKRLDVPLYKRDNGTYYVLHRIIAVRKNDYLISGDNRWNVEKGISDRHIIGVLKAVMRNAGVEGKKQKLIRVDSFGYRLYSHLWCDLFPIRSFIFLCRDVMKRLWKMLAVLAVVAVGIASCTPQTPEQTPDDPIEEEPKKDPVPEPEPIDYDKIVPAFYLTTPGRKTIDSKEYWVENVSFMMSTDGVNVESLCNTSAKLRGNSSLWYPKKSYNLKLDEKISLCGMPASKRWCLLACWMDRTMLRNDVAFEISRRTSLAWTPRGKFVRLYMNGKYDGLYYLVEKIKIAKNRVNISDDGYIVELDTYYDEVNKFKSSKLQLPVNFKEPDEDLMTNEKFWAFQDYFNQTEKYICGSSTPDARYKDMIDMTSFVDYMIIQELIENAESMHPKSMYLYKDVDGKLYAGPTWDHDWYTYVPDVTWQCCSCYVWYKYLMRDKDFKNLVVERWNAIRPQMISIPDYIDAKADLIREYDAANARMWPINQDVNGDEKMDFDSSVSRMKKAFNARISWMDKYVNSLK